MKADLFNSGSAFPVTFDPTLLLGNFSCHFLNRFYCSVSDCFRSVFFLTPICEQQQQPSLSCSCSGWRKKEGNCCSLHSVGDRGLGSRVRNELRKKRKREIEEKRREERKEREREKERKKERSCN
jgi:hypothetical protein